MPRITALSAILAFCASQVAAHSWINNPPQRFDADPNYCLKNDDGSLFVDGNNKNLCGQDAQGIDLMVMRPNSFRENPCYFAPGATFQNLPTRIVETDSTMCMQWAANSHNGDPNRNTDGGVRISLSTNLNNPSQADFDKMIIANNIPYENFAGAKVKIPSLPLGNYVLQYYWSWPFGNNGHRLFVSCSNITVVEKGNPRLQVENSAAFPGLGLPAGFNRAPSDWFCNPEHQVHGNSSLPNGAGSPAATTAPATMTDNKSNGISASTTAAPTTAAPTTAAPATKSAGSATAPAGTAAPAAPVAGRVTISDQVDKLSLTVEPCTSSDDITIIGNVQYKQKCLSVDNQVYSTLKFLTIRIRSQTAPIVRGLGGMSVESETSRTYNFDLFGGVPKMSQLVKTSSFFYPVGSSVSVEFAGHSY